MTFFAISRKTIAAVLLALAAVLFSSSAKALDVVYVATPISGQSVRVSLGGYSEDLPIDYSYGSLYTRATISFSPFASDYKVLKYEMEVPVGYDFGGYCQLKENISFGSQPISPSQFDTGNPICLNPIFECDYSKICPKSFIMGGTMDTYYLYAYPLYANLIPQKYAVVFDSLGGSSCSNQEITFDGTYAGKLPTPIRSGYTFSGWYTSQTGDTEITESTVVKTTTDQTLYARWQALTPTITFNPQSGSVSPASQTITYGSSYTLPTPTRTGYNFDGWYTAETGGTKIADKGTAAFLVDQTLYAHWSIIRTQYTFGKSDSSTGSGTTDPSGTRTYDYGTEIQLKATPATGSEFVKWNDGVTTAERTITVGSESKTYSAEFALKTFTVTFDAGEGSVSTTSKTVTYSQKYGELPRPTLAGHSFVEWQKPGGTRITADDTVYLDGDLVLRAVYSANRYQIIVLRDDAFEGSGAVSGGGFFDYGTTTKIQANANTGSHFVSWNDGNTSATRDIVVTANCEYLARFDLNEYTVTFEYYDAKEQKASVSQKVKYGKAATPPDNGIVDQYPKHHFTGWGNTSYETVNGNMTIQANYDWNTYTVRYSANAKGVFGSMSDQTLRVDIPYALSENRFTRTGYDFVGWALKSDASTRDYSDKENVYPLTYEHQATVVLYALWSPRTYTVTFSDDVREVEPKSKSVVYDSTYGTLPNLTRTGYTFDGWFTAKSGGTKIESTTKVSITSDQTLYAHWTAQTFALSYEVGCEGVTPPVATTVTFDSTYSGKLPSLSRKGYTFNGWYTAQTGGDKIEVSTKVAITSAQTLYAHWKPNTYTVYFNRNGGDEPSAASVTVTYDSTYGDLPTCSRTGYDFDGWYTTTTGGDKIVASTKVAITGNQSLYAHWTAKTFAVTTSAVNCTISAPATGTFEKPYSFSWTAPEDKKGYTTSNPAIAIYRGADTNGTLVATYSYGTSMSYTMSVTYSEALHITGRYTYTPNKYTVEFDTAGGGSVSSRQVTYDAAYGTLPELKKKNHKFCGWWDAEGNLIDETTIVSIAENHTLTAKWERETYTIRFDPGEGEGNMSDQVANCGENTVLKANTFTKVGYLFKDWVCGDGESHHSDGATVKDLVNANEIAVLTAEWTNIVYTIAFDANWKLGDGVLKSEVPEPLTECKYDKVKTLTVWTPETGGMAAFCGWALDPSAEEPDYINGEEISNLTTVGGATVTLYAVWEDTLSALSRAVGCNNANLVAEAGRDDSSALVLPWKPCESGGGIGSGEVTLRDKYTEASSRLSLVVSTNGTLVFVCKMTTPGAKGVFKIYGNTAFTLTEVTESTRYVFEATGAKGATFAWWGYGPADSFVIESLRWYPGLKPNEIPAEHPKPTEADAPAIKSDFSFATDKRFDYVIWKKTDLSETEWSKHQTVAGDGKAVSLPMFVGKQGFFKVEVIQRKAQ